METIFTLEDLPYVQDGIYCFGLCEGEPTDREVYHRKIHRTNVGKDKLAISKQCPACGGYNTEWIRDTWNICFSCEIAFEEETYIDLSECDNPEEVEDGLYHVDGEAL